MKYIEINTRNIFLREDSIRGLVLRGEIPGCGAGCHADLGEVFIEYAMSCQGCEDPAVMVAEMDQFGQRLGKIVASALMMGGQEYPAVELSESILIVIMNSLRMPFQHEKPADLLIFNFDEPPLEASARKSGLRLWLKPARNGFEVFLESVLASCGSHWRLKRPAPEDGGNPNIFLFEPAA